MFDYKLLIIGNIFDSHLIRFIRNLKKFNNNILIDVITFKQQNPIPEEITELTNSVYYFTPNTQQKLFVQVFQRIHKFNVLLKDILQVIHYDIVNIHYPYYDYAFALRHLKKMADNIVLTPWGSDVYRISKTKLYILKFLYHNVDYVCNPDTRFGKDVRKIFNLKKEQIINLSMGSETIDYIVEHKETETVSEARHNLALEGDYFITCGYNAHSAQNHVAIVDGISRIKNIFPGQLSLIFPMTYPKNSNYIEKIKAYVLSKGLKAYFFTDYLDLPTLLRLRQSTDMFIHVQDTDANAASVQEYLLLEKKVLNGEWLRYDNMEIDGEIPYTLVKDLNSISEAVVNSLNKKTEISSKLYDYLVSSGWNKWIIQWDTFFKKISINYNINRDL